LAWFPKPCRQGGPCGAAIPWKRTWWTLCARVSQKARGEPAEQPPVQKEKINV
jgi:hypothetical protein